MRLIGHVISALQAYRGKIFCKYVCLLGKRRFFDHFIITTITIAINLSILSQVLDANNFLADLVVELVLLPSSVSSAMFLTLTNSRLIWL